MNWSELALFMSGIFFGGAIDHMILAAMGSELTHYQIRVGVGGKWAFAVFDAVVMVLLFLVHRKLAGGFHSIAS